MCGKVRFKNRARLVLGVDALDEVHEEEERKQLGVAHHNTNPKPFIWTKSAADILQKVIRANSRLSSKQNATLH